MIKVSTDGSEYEFQKYRKTALAEAVQMPETFEVATLEGTMIGQAGDFLMRGAAGELYPCAAHVFEQTYELAEDEPPTNIEPGLFTRTEEVKS
jgi:hypothetical protein